MEPYYKNKYPINGYLKIKDVKLHYNNQYRQVHPYGYFSVKLVFSFILSSLWNLTIKHFLSCNLIRILWNGSHSSVETPGTSYSKLYSRWDGLPFPLKSIYLQNSFNSFFVVGTDQISRSCCFSLFLCSFRYFLLVFVSTPEATALTGILRGFGF